MKQAFIYLGSAIVALLLSYGVNQLPNVPEAVKPSVPFVLVALVVIGVWLSLQQSSGMSATSASGNKIKGKKNKVRGRMGSRVDRNEIDGDENELGIDDGTNGSGPNP